MRDNPNARGGSIRVEPKAPNLRLDQTLQRMENPKDYTSIPLYDLMVDLGILDKPVVGKGKPAVSKRIPKKVLISSIMSIFMMGLVQGRSPSKKGQLKSIPDDLL